MCVCKNKRKESWSNLVWLHLAERVHFWFQVCWCVSNFCICFLFFATHEVCCKRAKKSALLSQNVRSRWNWWRGWSAGQVSYTHTQQFIRRLVSPFIFLHVLSSALFLFLNYPLPLLHISSFILLFCFVTYCATFVSQQPHSTTISLIGKCLKTLCWWLHNRHCLLNSKSSSACRALWKFFFGG